MKTPLLEAEALMAAQKLMSPYEGAVEIRPCADGIEFQCPEGRIFLIHRTQLEDPVKYEFDLKVRSQESPIRLRQNLDGWKRFVGG